MGEVANSDGEMAAGKLHWLKRPALGRSADMVLDLVFVSCSASCSDCHGFQQDRAVDISWSTSVRDCCFVLSVGASGGLFPPAGGTASTKENTV